MSTPADATLANLDRLLPDGDGPTVMLRADMDALPVQEATGLPYASKVTATDHGGKTVR